MSRFYGSLCTVVLVVVVLIIFVLQLFLQTFSCVFRVLIAGKAATTGIEIISPTPPGNFQSQKVRNWRRFHKSTLTLYKI